MGECSPAAALRAPRFRCGRRPFAQSLPRRGASLDGGYNLHQRRRSRNFPSPAEPAVARPSICTALARSRRHPHRAPRRRRPLGRHRPERSPSRSARRRDCSPGGRTARCSAEPPAAHPRRGPGVGPAASAATRAPSTPTAADGPAEPVLGAPGVGLEAFEARQPGWHRRLRRRGPHHQPSRARSATVQPSLFDAGSRRTGKTNGMDAGTPGQRTPASGRAASAQRIWHPERGNPTIRCEARGWAVTAPRSAGHAEWYRDIDARKCTRAHGNGRTAQSCSSVSLARKNVDRSARREAGRLPAPARLVSPRRRQSSGGRLQRRQT